MNAISTSLASPQNGSNAKPTDPRPPCLERLSMTFDQRLLLACSVGLAGGLFLGSSYAGHMAGLRFRAENAHRLPQTPTGWYLYHKSKNYYRMRAGLKEGIAKGVTMAAWVGVFFILEESVDIFRGTWRAGRTVDKIQGVDELDAHEMHKGVEKSRDFISTACAGVGTSGLWSLVNRFPVPTAARTIKVGLLVGAGYGLAQDAISLLKGQKVGYVDRIRRGFTKWTKQGDQAQQAGT